MLRRLLLLIGEGTGLFGRRGFVNNIGNAAGEHPVGAASALKLRAAERSFHWRQRNGQRNVGEHLPDIPDI